MPRKYIYYFENKLINMSTFIEIQMSTYFGKVTSLELMTFMKESSVLIKEKIKYIVIHCLNSR